MSLGWRTFLSTIAKFVDMMLLGSLSDRVSVPDVEELEQVLAGLCL